ncbi:unnamed protein product [Clonostachys rosea f. rosea IK726]|uniref:Uncharacterized protein n=1 Tax=Clonostachys rosea f. rosea IK726 TaxID=1349383 RepID=A0ACA9TYY0_BIOOC|nr:unnamed protein product [Clonostachys rosea f. rosea IK726]
MGSSIDNPKAESILTEFLKERPNLRFIRLQWIDYSGVLRARIITPERCLQIARGADICTLSQNCMVIPISTAPKCWPDGIEEWHLLPDWDSLIVCGFSPSHASVMCFTSCDNLENPLARCPRFALCQSLEVFDVLFGEHHILMGFEIEFVFLDETYTPLQSLDQTVGYSMLSGLRGKNLDIIETIMDSLIASGIDVHHFHVEAVHQYEIALSALPPLRAIDSLIMAMETIRTQALRHGVRATVTPSPVLSGPMSGIHAHFSINPNPPNSSSFLSGVLARMKSLCAFGLSNYDSYCRIAPDCAGEWIAWGTGNKDLPIRQVHPGRWEFRFLDATANAYLFTSAIISAGIDGMKTGLVLEMKDCTVVPSALGSEEVDVKLRDVGVTDRMPKTLQESLEAAKADHEIIKWIGRELHNQYIRVKEKEAEYFLKMTTDERRRKFLDYF